MLPENPQALKIQLIYLKKPDRPASEYSRRFFQKMIGRVGKPDRSEPAHGMTADSSDPFQLFYSLMDRSFYTSGICDDTAVGNDSFQVFQVFGVIFNRGAQKI